MAILASSLSSRPNRIQAPAEELGFCPSGWLSITYHRPRVCIERIQEKGLIHAIPDQA